MPRFTSKSATLPVSVCLFGVGLVAVVVIFGMGATGVRNLPLWLNLAAMLAPLGLITGVVTVILRARGTYHP
ncbi:putative membrane protein YhdT [Saccharopolyspora lacisalsi]|uniref:Putative membrane protein YhdT n=1 Tax=Halosaccharopolyspora lacisalsi TaxID=1000566 RepID=A0A839E4R8_9PSEU|nr:hypothetical protein [Halosaccharopolyspora lacisalsi]MBA8826727.1 putative membrane protein YhdT [Halosaccharopolyspora lacisalsi]